jgi:hypothetical protein
MTPLIREAPSLTSEAFTGHIDAARPPRTEDPTIVPPHTLGPPNGRKRQGLTDDEVVVKDILASARKRRLPSEPSNATKLRGTPGCTGSERYMEAW